MQAAKVELRRGPGDAGRRVVVREYGETPMDALAEHVELVAQPWPDTGALADDDVIVEVRSAGVVWVDLLMTSGQYQHMVMPPYCPGMEYSGVVAWTGPGVNPEALAVGDAVYADGLLTGPRSIGGHQDQGGWATWSVAPAGALRRLPAGFDFDQGATFLGNYETAWHCLVACGRLEAGETVLIHGASGATGLAAVHVAKRLGARVIATGRSREKLETVRAQGADETVRIGEGEPRLRDLIKELTGGAGVDVVYDGVGGPLSAESLRCVRFGARYLIVGWAATPFVAKGRGQRGAPNANQLPTNLIMMKGLEVRGCPTVIATMMDPSIREARLRQLREWVEAGELTPHVSHRFPLSRFDEAMRARWTSQPVGGCVINPD